MPEYPDFAKVIQKRVKRIKLLKGNPDMIASAKAHYKEHPIDYIRHWGVTYDPRNAGTLVPTLMPFVPFKRQIEFIDFLHDCMLDQEHGASEKCRDVGATWIACNFTDWLWRFHDGSSIGWGSRKEQLVDKMGDPDSIFEKLRMVQENIPSFFQPEGWNARVHSTYMKIINPENGSTITGEAGDNIGRGGRKAQPLDSKILTPLGWSIMGDMEVGGKIIGSNGKSQEVIGVYPQGIKSIYKITFSDGASTECCDEHLWKVTTRQNRKTNNYRKNKGLIKPDNFEVEYTATIMQNLTVNRNDDQIEYQYQIPMVSPIEFEEQELPLDPYLLGCLIGDGSFASMAKSSIGYSTADGEIIDILNTKLKNNYKFKKISKYDYRITDGIRTGKGNKCWLKTIITNLGLSGTRSYEKFIPDIYKFSSPENRLEMLRGLIDTDGCIGKVSGKPARKVVYSTSSKQLAEDVRFLVWSFGGTAYCSSRIPKIGDVEHRLSYSITITMPDGIKPVKIKRRSDRYTDKEKYKPRRSITNIEYIGEKEAQCIAVDSNDNLYITDDFILTHNTIYFVDESAHLERPEKIEAALGDNTNIQIHISSVNGPTTVFQRKIDAGEIWESDKEIASGKTRVFIFDWTDHPLKTQEWYDKRRAKAAEEGMLHIFAQEVERDATAAVEGVLIPGSWVAAAVDAHLKLKINISGEKIGAFDVADGGKDKQGLAIRHGILQGVSKIWESPDVGLATQKALFHCIRNKVTSFQYDSMGVGAGAKSELNRLKREKLLPEVISVVAWNASGKVLRPEARVIRGDRQSQKNKDFYANLKAQGWWQLRLRFEKTYKMINDLGMYDVDDLISLDSNMAGLHDLKKELSQPTYAPNGAGKILINKTPDGMKSPNRADSTMMAYWPKRKISVMI